METGSADQRLTDSRAGEDKLSTMKAYRRAKGQCDKCGERWSHTHKCSTTV
jgi:hypothetical protein